VTVRGVLIVENEAITGGVGEVCGRGFITSWGVSMIGVSVFKT
jgi:hypothetical protein